MNSNTVINFNMEQGVSVASCVHSYGELQQIKADCNLNKNPSKIMPQIKETQSVPQIVSGEQKTQESQTLVQSEEEKKEPMVFGRQECDTYDFSEKKTMSEKIVSKEMICEEQSQEMSEENIPLIHQVINRDEAKNFTEYVLSRPVTFAHKCEDVMATCSALAIMTGVGAIGTIYYSDIIPSHNQIALGFACATGICLLGTVLSGVAGGISDCWQERKNRLMQEKMERSRD